MLYMDKELSKELSIPIYRYRNKKGLKILTHTCGDNNTIYEGNDYLLCEQRSKYYVLGATPNTNYSGFQITNSEYENLKEFEFNSDKLIDLYNEYERIAF